MNLEKRFEQKYNIPAKKEINGLLIYDEKYIKYLNSIIDAQNEYIDWINGYGYGNKIFIDKLKKII